MILDWKHIRPYFSKSMGMNVSDCFLSRKGMKSVISIGRLPLLPMVSRGFRTFLNIFRNRAASSALRYKNDMQESPVSNICTLLSKWLVLSFINDLVHLYFSYVSIRWIPSKILSRFHWLWDTIKRAAEWQIFYSLLFRCPNFQKDTHSSTSEVEPLKLSFICRIRGVK